MPSKIDPLVSLMKVEKVPDSTYDMVGGVDKQIKEMKEVVELPIKHPELFESLGVAQPKGVLLYGPPGTGKTLLARAVAHHTDCTFIRVSGGELVQKYIGEGSRMVRELFVMAREHAPSIIFMDEVPIPTLGYFPWTAFPAADVGVSTRRLRVGWCVSVRRWTRSVRRVGTARATARCSARCWSFSTSSTASRRPTRSRS
eukprot:COSAG04_NODE_3240_length_3016_cov_1.415153_3_plen_200_part_00